MAFAGVRVHVIEALVIANANNPGGSMGTFRYLDRFGRGIMRRARVIAPVGNILDRLHDSNVPGEYQRSFEMLRVTGGHRQYRRIYNRSDHAGVVEFGRSRSGKYERFTTKHRPLTLIERPRGTPARGGEHTLARAAFAEAVQRRVPFVPAVPFR